MEWVGVTAHDEKKTVLKVRDVGVARMSERLDGSWFVYLWYHRPESEKVQRDCSGFEQGKAGAEQWARRHMAVLVQEAAVVRSKWAVLPQPDLNRVIDHRPIFPDGDPPHPGKPRGVRRPRRAW